MQIRYFVVELRKPRRTDHLTRAGNMAARKTPHGAGLGLVDYVRRYAFSVKACRYHAAVDTALPTIAPYRACVDGSA